MYQSFLQLFIQKQTHMYSSLGTPIWGKTWRSDEKFSTKSALAEFNGCGFRSQATQWPPATTADVHEEVKRKSSGGLKMLKMDVGLSVRIKSASATTFYRFRDQTDGFSNQNILTFQLKKGCSATKRFPLEISSLKRGAVTAKASLWPLSVCPLLV